MALTPKQNFKFAFLAICAEAGLTIPETKAFVKKAIQIQKQAKLEKIANPLALLGAALKSGIGAGIGLIPTVGSAAMLAGVGAPIAAGAGGGLLAAKATSSDNKGVLEDAKTDEIVGEYERLAEEAKRRARLKHLQQATGRKVIALSPGE